MTDASVVQIGLDALVLAAKLAGPILLMTLGVGVMVGLVQSVTQLQEPTLTFVPKFVGVGIVVVLCGNWMLGEAIAFTQMLFERIPELLG
jgi:flagellar biosynthetic protein FliQ